MPDTQLSPVLRHIHKLVGAGPGAGPTDADLLERFVRDRDEAAFAGLVERHGRMVLGVCRNILRQQQDAEDAFQATFLVLARKAGSIRWKESVANWLYGVAYRVSARARSSAGRRWARERRAGKMAEAKPDLEWAFRELESVLTEEVGRLPQKYRAAFVACCLEGMSKAEAARHLGWKEGTVSGRLAEARKRLQTRLSRRGLTLAGALCVGAVSTATRAAVPAPLAKMTVKAALAGAAGKYAATVSAHVAGLAEEVSKAMSVSKPKLLTLIVLTTGLVAAAGTRLYRPAGAAPPAPPAAQAAPAGAKAPAGPAVKPAAKPPAQDPKEEVTVQGQVVNQEGKPVAGARVLLPRVGENGKGADPVRTASGEDGRFRFTTRRGDLQGYGSLAAAADGYGLAWVATSAVGTGDVTLKLVPDLPIQGRIRDLEGRPLAGISVVPYGVKTTPADDLTPVLANWNPDSNSVSRQMTKELFQSDRGWFLPSTKTDAEGRFTLRGVGRDRVAVLVVSGPGVERKVLYVFCRPGVDARDLSRPERRQMPGMPRFNLPALHGPTFDHVLGPSKPVEGTVRDKATGKGIAKVHINGSAEGSWWEEYVMTETDADGHYRLAGLPVAQAYRLTTYTPDEVGYLPGGKKLGGSEGLKPLTLDFDLVRGIRVTGRVIDKATGEPVSAALWYTPLADNKFFKDLPGNEWYRMVSQGHRTEKDGSYTLLALPGTGLIKVRAEVEPNPYVEAAVDPADAKKAYSTKGDGLGPSFLSAAGHIEPLFGHNAYRIIEPDAAAGACPCNFELDRGRTVTGEVLDPDGKPLAGASAGGLTPVWGKNVVLKDANFTARAVSSASPRTLAFLHKGRKLAGSVEVGPGEKGPVKVRLRPWGAVEGRVLDEEGNPVAGAEVQLYYPQTTVNWLSGEVVGAGKTDAAGKFRVEGVIPGLEFGVGFKKDRNFLDAGEGYRSLKAEPGKTNGLGDVRTKVYRLP
jgi:RNA polymerase sigma factor (sigma-70 family)